MRTPIHQVHEGQPLVYPLRTKVGLVCCDCDLAHKFLFEVDASGEQLVVRAWRDEKLTRELRRAKKRKG